MNVQAPLRLHFLVPPLMLLGLGCEPAPDEPAPPPGSLEYESRLTNIYRLDRRIDVIRTVDGEVDRSCGILSDRAFHDLQGAIDALDPTVDYDFGLDGEDCTYVGGPEAQIHLPGFEHSPFSCDEFCCQADLRPVPRVYLHAINNLEGTVFEVDGEPYVAVEPNESCS